MKPVLAVVAMLLLCGCADEVAAAKAVASFWKMTAFIGGIVALLIGIALGSRDKP